MNIGVFGSPTLLPQFIPMQCTMCVHFDVHICAVSNGVLLLHQCKLDEHMYFYFSPPTIGLRCIFSFLNFSANAEVCGGNIVLYEASQPNRNMIYVFCPRGRFVQITPRLHT